MDPGIAVPSRVLALGEVLWDVFDESTRLGGAPLNFIVHVCRMGHEAILISAVGADELGDSARTVIQALGPDPGFIQTTGQFPTGTAAVQLGANGQTHFRIQRPAAYDAVQLSEPQIAALARWAPRWLYFGTLFLVTEQGLKTLRTLVSALPGAATIYDLNLRPESYSPQLDFPWLARWEENHLREQRAWIGRGLACGMEFGVSPWWKREGKWSSAAAFLEPQHTGGSPPKHAYG